MKDELKSKMAGAVREQNGRRRETEKAAAFLRDSGATDLRGVYHKRPGWWSADNIFLGARGPLRRVPNSSALTGAIKLGAEEPIPLHRS
jgi:hypothetical protein